MQIEIKYIQSMQDTLVPKKDTLQTILQHRIGFGSGQNKLLKSLYLLLFTEGSESIVLGLLIPELAAEWAITTFDKSLLITLVYVGVSLGSYIQTYSDNYGRYKFLLIDAIITSFFGFISAFSPNFNFFLVTRFFYGIGIGIALPLTATYITQIVPASHRASIMSLSRIYWSAGCLFACVLGWILMTSSHWRLMLFLLSIPNFYALYDIITNGKQSLRYLWVKGNAQKCKIVLDILAQGNHRDHISYQQITQQIRKFQYEKKSQQNQTKSAADYFQLLGPKYRKQTLILCYSWAVCCFNYYILVLVLPSILSRHSQISSNFQYLFIIIVSVFQVFSFYSSQALMDNPSFGRKKSLVYGTASICLLCTLVIIVGQNRYIFLLLMFVMIKIFSTISFMILYPYSAEIYETKVRGFAMGVFSLCGRIATAFIGIIGISALEWFGGYGLYIIMAVASGINSLAIKQMPYCTLGRELDT